MEQNERKTDNHGSEAKEPVREVVYSPQPYQIYQNNDEVSIDLARVFHTMKVKSRIFAWVLILCMLVGVCAPLVIYQFVRPMLSLSSVVTLNYEHPVLEEDGQGNLILPENPTYTQVADLTAPDGRELDLAQITSAYVLQNALSGLKLSYTPTLANLRDNITVQRTLTEESARNQELLAQMVNDKNAAMYEQFRATEFTFTNRFIVTLKNGFGDENSRVKKELKDDELKILLDRILDSYNAYLIREYADQKLPEDMLAVIDVENLDALENLEALRDASDELYNFCDAKSDNVKAYRSYRDGQSLNDWMAFIRNSRENSIDYLYSYIYSSRYSQDRDTLTAGYKYQLREAQAKLDTANENIIYVSNMLASYQNDEILVPSAMENEGTETVTTQTTTKYYNDLYLQQAKNYAEVEKLEVEIAELEDKIALMSEESGAEIEMDPEAISGELIHTVETFRDIYDRVTAHIREIQESGLYSVMAEHTEAQGKSESFLTANLRNMAIGAAVGMVIALGLWFLAALAPEFRRGREEEFEKGAALK